MNSAFYLHEDDWGMIEFAPLENRLQSEHVVSEAREHWEVHRAPDRAGWTTLYVAPGPAIKLAARGIRVDELAAVLGASWRRYARVESGYSSYRESVSDGFAFTDGRDVVYGTLAGERVATLFAKDASTTLRDTLLLLGTTYRLLLIDLWRDHVVDLSDEGVVDQYLTSG
jgi:hypothetical protein